MLSLTEKVIFGDFIVISGLKLLKCIYLWEALPPASSPVTPLAEVEPSASTVPSHSRVSAMKTLYKDFFQWK